MKKTIVAILVVGLLLAGFAATAFAFSYCVPSYGCYNCDVGLMNSPVTIISGDYFFGENPYPFVNDPTGWKMGWIYVNQNGMSFSGDFHNLNVNNNIIRAAIQGNYVRGMKIVWMGENRLNGNDHFQVFVNGDVYAGTFWAEGEIDLNGEWSNVLTICGPGI